MGAVSTISKNRTVLLLSAGHACVDVYQGAVAALVPFLAAERGYGYAAVSGVVLAASLLSSVAQPLFGALTDRRPAPWLLPAGTVAAGAGIAAVGVVEGYWAVLAAVALSGVGVAAYHPESARVARIAARGGHTSMGWFSLGGNAGFAVAPVLVTAVVAGAGLAGTPLLGLPAAIGAVLCVSAVRRLGGARGGGVGARGADAPSRPDDVRSFLRLASAVGLRSVVYVGLSTFIALYAQERVGGGAAVGAAALFLLYCGGAVGTVVGGRLAERRDRVAVVRWAYLCAVGAVAGAVLVPGPAMLVFVAAASGALYVPFSLQVTLAQDYLPNRVGTAGGVTLGLAVSVGGVASPAVGAVADAASLQAALAPLIALPLLSWLAVRRLREPAVPERPGSR